jgi:hypothetical protein
MSRRRRRETRRARWKATDTAVAAGDGNESPVAARG